MNFLVIGHPCLDEIHTAEGSIVTSWGGIIYALAALDFAAQESDVIHPVFPIGREDEEAFRNFIARFPHIDAEGVYPVDAPTNRVRLFYPEGDQYGARQEHCACVLPPVDFDALRSPMRENDLVLVNMVSGFEVTLETMQRIYKAGHRQTPIYLDVHAMTLGELVTDGPRRFRRVVDWRDWMQSSNFVQMNEREAKYFGRSPKAIADFAAFDRRVESIVITRGALGSTILVRDAAPELPVVNDTFSRIDIPPVSLGPALDSTGCGDVFGAAFLASYAWRRNPVIAAQFGNFAGAAKSLIAGIGQLDILRTYIQQYPRFG